MHLLVYIPNTAAVVFLTSSDLFCCFLLILNSSVSPSNSGGNVSRVLAERLHLGAIRGLEGDTVIQSAVGFVEGN